jgi:hypothetical protein
MRLNANTGICDDLRANYKETLVFAKI